MDGWNFRQHTPQAVAGRSLVVNDQYS